MGIKQLSKVLGDYAPKAMKENEIKSYFGRKVAIDASMSLYQFLIAIRGSDGGVMAGEDGEATRFFLPFFWRGAIKSFVSHLAISSACFIVL